MQDAIQVTTVLSTMLASKDPSSISGAETKHPTDPRYCLALRVI